LHCQGPRWFASTHGHPRAAWALATHNLIRPQPRIARAGYMRVRVLKSKCSPGPPPGRCRQRAPGLGRGG